MNAVEHILQARKVRSTLVHPTIFNRQNFIQLAKWFQQIERIFVTQHGSNRLNAHGQDAVRLEVADPSQADSDVLMHINNRWNYRNLGLGNYMKPRIIVKSGYSNFVRLRLFLDTQ